MHEGQRHELGEAAGLRLQIAHREKMPRPVTRDVSTWPNMIVAVVLQAELMRGSHDIEPLRGVQLVRADDRADLVVENLGGGAGQRAQARASLSLARNDRIGSSSVAAPCVTSSGEKAWMCMSGTAALMARQIAR